jgi:aryl-alcohol dehydrogenase-like predicted oxidoreductase
MQCRPLGKTGLHVSAVGFGAWGIGGYTHGGRSYGPTDDKTSLATLDAALDAGITFYDTAPLYGLGHSEELIGRAFRERRDRVVIATKVGYQDFISPPDFSPNGIRRSLEGSLRRLRSDYVDVLQLHDPGDGVLADNPDVMETLRALRAEGVIRVIGVSVKSPSHALPLIEEGVVQVIQANFNMMDLRAVECGLMARAESLGVGIIARTPLCFGFLTGRLDGTEDFPAEDHRSLWPQRQLQAWADGARHLLDTEDRDQDECGTTTALRFVLSFPAVATTIPGMLTPAHVEENTEAGRRRPLSVPAVAEVLRRCRAHGGFMAQREE